MTAPVTNIAEKRIEEEKQNLESRIQHSQIMESIATLAGGIAHQFNNALTGISGNIELLEIALLEGKDLRIYSERIKALVGNMTHLTDHLLAYARGGKYQPKIFALNDLVKESLPMIHQKINPAIKIDTELPYNISNIKADFTQMQMVLSAVVANSIESIAGTGHIRIRTKNKHISPDPALDFPGLNEGIYACIVIEDDGRGMDENTKSRLFEPFFTTKFQGRGLGMAAVYGIVKNHRGWISVDSTLGKGSSVCILLPAVAELTKPEKALRNEIIKGSGNILVVEDEDMVMDVSSAMLEALGYHVLGARTGNGAIEIIRACTGQIDLVLLDIGLPDMGGEKVYSHIKKISPNTKVVVCSGYAMEGPVQEIMHAGAQGFIQKPFSIVALSSKLKEVLE